MEIDPPDSNISESSENPTAKFLFDGPPVTESIEPTPSETNLDQPAVVAPTVVEEPKSQTPPAVVATPAPTIPTLAVTDIVPPQVVVPGQAPAPVVPQQGQVAPAPAPAAPAPVAPQAPSPEQLRAQLNVYEMTEQDYDSIFATESKPESIKALNQVFQKVARQAVTMANALVQDNIQRVLSEVKPYMQFADEQRLSMVEQSFYSTNPDLKGQEPLVEAVVQALVQKGVKFNNPQEMFTAVATNVKAYQQQLGGQTQNQGQGAPVGAPAARPRMVPLSTGSQGGAAPSGGSGTGKSTARAIFG